MPTIDFPGGAIGNFGPSFFLDTNDFIQQELVGFPNAAAGARVNIDGNYAIRVASISPDRLTGTNSKAIVYANVLHGEGAIILSSTNPATTCAVRVTKTGGTETTFRRDNVSTNAVIHYRYDGYTGGDYGAFLGRLSGSWVWTTVPSAPASISRTLNGTSVTVTRTNSAADGGAAIANYRVQRRESTDGTTWGAWGGTEVLATTTLSHTYTNLTPGRYHQFRMFAFNTAGFGSAATSTAVFITAITRYVGPSFTVLSKLRKYDGSAWQNITQVRRWNGTSWVAIDITGVNST